MGHSRIFGFLAITLCIVCSVYAYALVDIGEATESVNDATKATKVTWKTAKTQLKQARSASKRVKLWKERAEQAAYKAQEAANGNKEAEVIAEKAHSATEAFLKLYVSGSESVQKAVTSMETLLSEVKRLKGESVIVIRPNDNSGRDYTKTKKEATDLIAETNVLNAKLTEALQLIGAALSVELKAEKIAEGAQLERYHVDAFVAVSKIKTILKDADAIIQKTEQKRDEINDTLKKMNRLNQNIPTQLISYINALCTHAEGDLRYASETVDEAKKAKESMLQLKKLADESLAKIKSETIVKEAQSEAERTAWFAKNVAKKAPTIASALISADISAKNAEKRKKKLLRALPKRNNHHGTNRGKKTQDSEHSPTGKLKNTASDDPEQTVNNNAEQIPSDGLTTTADMEEIFTSDENNDSAITVSLSLLLALIACAALH